MKPSTRSAILAIILSGLGTLSSAVWGLKIEGGVLIGFALVSLLTSYVCESIERTSK